MSVFHTNTRNLGEAILHVQQNIEAYRASVSSCIAYTPNDVTSGLQGTGLFALSETEGLTFALDDFAYSMEDIANALVAEGIIESADQFVASMIPHDILHTPCYKFEERVCALAESKHGPNWRDNVTACNERNLRMKIIVFLKIRLIKHAKAYSKRLVFRPRRKTENQTDVGRPSPTTVVSYIFFSLLCVFILSFAHIISSCIESITASPCCRRQKVQGCQHSRHW